jgi:hypothetical protein
MYVFALDKDGRLGGFMSERTAAKVVASGRARWVGVNCVQFSKRFKRPIPLEKLLERGVPLPDTARPEVAWTNGDKKYEVRDIAERPRGREIPETRRLCREAFEEFECKLRGENAAESAENLPNTAGALMQTLGLAAGEKPVKCGYPVSPGKRKPGCERPGPLTIITGAFPPQRRYAPADVGAGLTRQARKTARRRAFQRLAKLHDDLRRCLDLPEWPTEIKTKKRQGNQYVNRAYLIDEIQNLIDRLWGSQAYWEYRQLLEEIVAESQVPCRP